MNAATLRKWKILNHLLDEELAKLLSAHIFEVGDGLGALLLTKEDEVYYVGHGGHALFRRDGDGNKGEAVKSKVEEMSGLGIKRLGVGDHFCVALTKQRSLSFWTSPGTGWAKKIPDSAFVAFRVHSKVPVHGDITCPDCGVGVDILSVAGLELSYCPDCEDIPSNPEVNQILAVLPRRCPDKARTPKIGNAKNSTSGTKDVVKLVQYNKAVVHCSICNSMCTPYAIDSGHEVNYCEPCDYLPRETDYANPPTTRKESFQEINLSDSAEMIDLACGKEFFVLLSSQNDLILWGRIADIKYEGILYKPDDVVVKAISCGSNHVAVLSVQGELFTCGQGHLGQLGYEWTRDMGYDTLRKVPLDGKVAKVCCGYSTTVCLTSDGSLVCFGSHMKILPSGLLALNRSMADYISKPARIEGVKRVKDVVNSPSTDIFAAKTENFVFTWGRENIKSARMQLVPSGGNLMAALADLPASFTFKTRKSGQSALRPYLNSDLYGKHHLSDLTLKLSDGDFPVHRLVLQANSIYFQDAFSKGDSENILDMKHYNPKAYRCLLEYFYQVPLTNLEASDIFDLYTLATSYKEVDIAEEVFDKLKAALNPLTVLPLLRKAKQLNCREVLEECNTFIGSPEFKHNLAEKVSQDPGKTMSLLEALEKN